ncbi:MAG: hypothetical protein NUV77_23275 [Thermoguttaceae bacterium]|jgi:hypothetical protein|nr:hypothetical protein [Thermoguttaceae bacterium]
MKASRLDLVWLLPALVCALVSLGFVGAMVGQAKALDTEIFGTRESGDLAPGHFDNGPVPGDEAADYIAEPAADCREFAALEDDEDGVVGWRESSIAERDEESEEPLMVNDGGDTEEADGPFGAFAPGRLLTSEDQSLVRRLHAQCEELPEVRQEMLNDYLETLGLEGIGFAVRFEDITGIAVLGMADDPRAVAALLGAYRLVQQGELSTDESIHAVREVLAGHGPHWGEGVDAILAGEGFVEAEAVALSADPPEGAGEAAGLDMRAAVPTWVIDALRGLAWRSVDGVWQAALSWSDRLTEIDWLAFLARAAARAANNFAHPDRDRW